MLACIVSNLRILLILSAIKAPSGNNLHLKEVAFKSRFWERCPHSSNGHAPKS